MDTDEKERLALTRDDSQKASAIRFRAARSLTGLGQKEMGVKGGIGKSTISNIEQGRAYPARPVMTYLFREHRIDYNFLILGVYAQIPTDVQDRLFPLLEVAHNEWDQEPSSS